MAPDIFGCYFENAVGARFLEDRWDVFYWKKGKAEVDFVVHGPRGERSEDFGSDFEICRLGFKLGKLTVDEAKF